MAMKFGIEKKGERFLVFNETTGVVKGNHKTKGEAQVQANMLQKEHNAGIEMVSARLTPKAEMVDEVDAL